MRKNKVKLSRKLMLYCCVGGLVFSSPLLRCQRLLAQSVSTESEEDMEFYISIRQDIQQYINDFMLGEISEEEYINGIQKTVAPKIDESEEKARLRNGENQYKEEYSDITVFSLYDECEELAQNTFGVTSQEIELFSKHPVKSAKAVTLASTAKEFSELLWEKWTLWQGNGDAYRHAYWSALMNNNIGKDFAYKESYAHEGYDVGTYNQINDLDVKMDIENNHRGRDLGDIYQANGLSNEQIGYCVLENTVAGGLVRIRKATQSSDYNVSFYNSFNKKTELMNRFIQTTDGGLYSVC